MTLNDIKALEELMDLWDEGHIDETELPEAHLLHQDGPTGPPTVAPLLPAPSPKEYKPKSKTFPTLQGNPSVWALTQQVTGDIRKTKWKGLLQSNPI